MFPASLQYWLQCLLPSVARQLQAGWAHFFLSAITLQPCNFRSNLPRRKSHKSLSLSIRIEVSIQVQP